MMRRTRRRSQNTTPETTEAAEPSSESVEQPRSRRYLLPFQINWLITGIVLLLILVGVFALLLNQGVVPAEIAMWWPAALAIPAVLWFLFSLFRRNVQGVLGSAALFGLSVSLVLSAQGIPLNSTLIGVLFIAVGAGIIIRGLLLRQVPISE